MILFVKSYIFIYLQSVVRPGEDPKKSKRNKRDEPDDAPADEDSSINKKARTDFGPSGYLSLKRSASASGLMSGVSGASASAGAGRGVGVRPSKHAKHVTT